MTHPVRPLLTAAVRRLRDAGVESPEQDARVLLSLVAGIEPARLPLLDALDEKGMAGHLTLYHWDLPQGLQDDGGWMSRDTAHRFADYAHEVARRFGDRLATIATHNEPWCTANLGYGNGQFAPGVADKKQSIQVSHHLLLSHGLAVPLIRANVPDARVGIALSLHPLRAASTDPRDLAAGVRTYIAANSAGTLVAMLLAPALLFYLSPGGTILLCGAAMILIGAAGLVRHQAHREAAL